jgi:Flp pilus assembly protein CpaB
MDRFLRFTLRHRRLLAATLTGFGVFFGLSAVTASPASRSVVVAARDLDSGVAVTAGDVRMVRVAPGVVPQRAVTRPSDVVGRLTSGAMRQGEMLSDRRTIAAGPLDGFGPGRVLTSVRVNDPGVLALLRTGDTVDVLAVAGDDRPKATIVANRARVVTVRRATSRFNESVPVGLAVSRASALALAARSLDSRLTLVATR